MANGVYSNAELVDTLIVDLNTIPKDLIDGQFVHACAIIAQMGQKLINLREGIKADLDGKDKTIEQLKETIRNLGQEVQDLTPEEFMKEFCKKDGAENGSN